MEGLDMRVLKEAYDFTIDEDGKLFGLTAGDMGWEYTGIILKGVTLDIWKQGVKTWVDKPKEG